MELYDKLRGNPRFVPELGLYEGWMTPLKWNFRTYALKITCSNGEVLYLIYVPGDHLYAFHKRQDETIYGGYVSDFFAIEDVLKKCKVEFVLREEMAKELGVI